MTPLARRVLVSLLPPLGLCVFTGVWVVDQAAFFVRLVREQRATLTGATPTSASPIRTGVRA